MATRHADNSRYDRDRDRGRYSPPPRRRSRSPPRRDRSRDRHFDRYGGGRFRDDRDRDRARDRDVRDSYRRDDRRDDRRERDLHRHRSRSPPRRDRDRDLDRERDRVGDRYRRDRDFDRDRAYDDRDRRRRSPSPRPASRQSATSFSDKRDRPNDSPREDKKKDAEAQAKDKQADRAAKLAEWKKLNAERLAKDKTATPGSGPSPSATVPSTPTVAETPPATELKPSFAKTKFQKIGTEKAKQKQPEKSTFRLDESAAARPLLAKSAGKPLTTAPTNRPASQVKSNSNIGSFGFKAKATEAESMTSKNALLDDGSETNKRKFQALPAFAPIEESDTVADDDAAMSDIGSDNEEANAQLQAKLEKRRAAITSENVTIEDAIMGESPAADEAAEKMDVDQNAAGEEEEMDSLDAFMATLHEMHPDTKHSQGETMFNDDLDPVQTSVEAEDLIALRAAKKKKKEVPVVDHSQIDYEPFRKKFYIEPAEVSRMTTEEVADLRHELDGITVKPADAPRPVTKWAQMGLLQSTMDVFTEVRYEKPTAIQAQAIPIAESGLDLVGIAKTGSGKTLAFGIPMIRHILDQRDLKSSDGPIGLILAPTRELSLQIASELRPFLRSSGITIKCAYGGSPISEQIGMIKKGGIHVLCATAGRLIDLLAANSGRVLNLKRVTYVVLDEADRMFDMGFEPQVTKILNSVRPDRQTILFSATFPIRMAALARKALKNPVEVIIGGRSKVASEITQVISFVEPGYDKKVHQTLLHLGHLFSENENSQVLIFTERQETAEDLLSKLFKNKYFSVDTIHGAKDQNDRNEAITNFKKHELDILIATSVAARGLDVPGLALVLNFDCPTHLEDYVHRCGRTGRAGNKGTAITLIEKPGQERFAVHVVKALKESGTEVPADLQEMANTFWEKVKSGEEQFYSGFGGKGLDKLDAAREREKKREKRALKLEDGEEDSEEEIELPPAKKIEVSGTGIVKASDEAAAEPAEQPSWQKLLNNKIVVSKTERPEAAATNKPLTAKQKAEMAAMKVDGRLSKKGMIHAGQPIDNKGPDSGAYHSTIEINDFPQKARWAVTNRTNVAKILDQTGVSITTKGTFYPPGKEPGELDLPKLYILVEGDTENVVTQAMMELTRLLREGTIAAEDAFAARGPTGRYSVV